MDCTSPDLVGTQTLSVKHAGKPASLATVVADKKIHAPFRYAGGKFYALKHILPIIPHHTHYVEPFCGGGRVYFAKRKAGSNWLNDVDAELINCYVNIRDHADEMVRMLSGEAATKERHAKYKRSEPIDSLGRAVRWYYLNRTSFSGIMKRENCYFGYGEKYSRPPSKWGDVIQSCSAKLQGVKITALDFEEVVDHTPDGSFIFIDPPYYATDQAKIYTHSFTKRDHVRLRDVLRRNHTRLKFLLTYDDHPDVRDMYGWAETCNRQWNYTIRRTDNQRDGAKLKDGFSGVRGKASELFIRNYG